jgi:hypothetical protein
MGLCLAGLHARRADFGPSCALCLWSAFVYTGQSNTKVWASFIGGLCQQSGDARLTSMEITQWRKDDKCFHCDDFL